METPSAAIVYTGQQGGRGDGTGGAAVLGGGPNLAFYAQMEQQRIMAEKAEKARQQLKRIEAGEKDKKTLQGLFDKLNAKPIWDKTDAEAAQRFDAQAKDLATRHASGSDPSDPLSDAGKMYMQYQRDNELWGQKNEDAKKIVGTWLATISDPKNEGKYRVERFDKVLSGLNDIKDGEGATNSIYDYVTNPDNNPFQVIAPYDETLKSLKSQLSYGPDGKVSQKDMMNAIDLYYGTADGPDKAKSHIMDGYGKDYDDLKIQTLKSLQASLQPKPPKAVKAAKTTTDKDTYDYQKTVENGKWGKDNAWDVLYRESNGVSEVVIKKGQDDLPLIQVKPLDVKTMKEGEDILFQPQKFYTENGKIYAQGMDENGKVKFASYETNKGQFQTQMDGFDIDKYIEANKNKGASTPPNGSDNSSTFTITIVVDGKTYTKKGLSKEQVEAKKKQHPNAVITPE